MKFSLNKILISYNKKGERQLHKYIVYNGDVKGKESIEFEYTVGEQIRVNSVDWYMCVKKEVINGDLLQYFKQGAITYNY